MEVAVFGVRVVHAVYVAFVCTAPALLWCVRGRPGLRWIGGVHLGCLAFVTAQLAFGWSCPLTALEARWGGAASGAFVVPEAWSGAGAIPPWVWPTLALAWAVSAGAWRVAGGPGGRLGAA